MGLFWQGTRRAGSAQGNSRKRAFRRWFFDTEDREVCKVMRKNCSGMNTCLIRTAPGFEHRFRLMGDEEEVFSAGIFL
jgi:hypothetical protein